MKSSYAELLNSLDDMQQSPVYAVRKRVLAEAECAIVRLEKEVEELRAEVESAELKKNGEAGAGGMKTIHKYVLDGVAPHDSFVGVKPLSVQLQGGDIDSLRVVVWAEVDTTATPTRVEFVHVYTGQRAPQGYKYIGTVQIEELVYHFYYRTEIPI